MLKARGKMGSSWSCCVDAVARCSRFGSGGAEVPATVLGVECWDLWLLAGLGKSDKSLR